MVSHNPMDTIILKTDTTLTHTPIGTNNHTHILTDKIPTGKVNIVATNIHITRESMSLVNHKMNVPPVVLNTQKGKKN